MNNYDFRLSVSKNILAEMPLVEYSGRIHIIDSIDQARQAIATLSQESVVGFDTETRPSFQRGRSYKMSLVQISTLTDSYLFRINRLGMFDELCRFIENGAVKKIGLSLKDDFFMMHKIGEFEPAGFIDLQSFVSSYAIIDASLQKIYGLIFGHRISKSQRLSNWEAETLSAAQCNYAAIDAWACLLIYNHLSQGLFHPEESPYRVITDEDNTIPAQ